MNLRRAPVANEPQTPTIVDSDSDPGAIGALNLWLDTSITPNVLRVRSADDSTWIDADAATSPTSPGGIVAAFVNASSVSAGVVPTTNATVSAGALTNITDQTDTTTCSVHLVADPYIDLDLGAVQKIVGIRSKTSRPSSPYTGQVSFSNDGVTYTPVGSYSIAGTLHVYYALPFPVSARYWRIDFPHGTAGQTLTIYSLDVLAGAGSGPLVVTEQVLASNETNPSVLTFSPDTPALPVQTQAVPIARGSLVGSDVNGNINGFTAGPAITIDDTAWTIGVTGAPQAITGALSGVTDADAKAVLTSIIAALVAEGLATNGTT